MDCPTKDITNRIRSHFPLFCRQVNKAPAAGSAAKEAQRQDGRAVGRGPLRVLWSFCLGWEIRKQCVMPSYSCIYQFVRDSLCGCGISWSFPSTTSTCFEACGRAKKEHWSISIAFFKSQSLRWSLLAREQNLFWRGFLNELTCCPLSQLFAFRSAFFSGMISS